MSLHRDVEITVLGGLPVTVDFSVHPIDPDVGIFESYIEEITIRKVARKPYKGKWIERRFDEDDILYQKALEACMDAI